MLPAWWRIDQASDHYAKSIQLAAHQQWLASASEAQRASSLDPLMPVYLVQEALSLVRSRDGQIGAKAEEFRDTDIHVHVPAGAVPKDGPSAGVAMFTALASLFSNTPVRPDVAMTGEITLRGLVLPIGGLKEKSLAAMRAGISTVIIPKLNEKDLVDVPEEAKQKLKFVAVENVDEVLNVALETNGAANTSPIASKVIGAPKP